MYTFFVVVQHIPDNERSHLLPQVAELNVFDNFSLWLFDLMTLKLNLEKKTAFCFHFRHHVTLSHYLDISINFVYSFFFSRFAIRCDWLLRPFFYHKNLSRFLYYSIFGFLLVVRST